MAVPPGAGSSSSSVPPSPSGAPPNGANKKKPNIGAILDAVAKIFVQVISLPFQFMAAIIAQFISGSGRAAVGGLIFLFGTLISSDSIWQTVLGRAPIFPWFEVGWHFANIPIALFNPFFYIAFLLGTGIQVIEAHAIRGKSPESAKKELDDNMHHDLGAKPSGKIDLVGELFSRYKTSGMRNAKSDGWIVAMVIIFDVATTFTARNPFSYTDPGKILGCLLFNFATMAAGEIGYNVWKMTRN